MKLLHTLHCEASGPVLGPYALLRLQSAEHHKSSTQAVQICPRAGLNRLKCPSSSLWSHLGARKYFKIAVQKMLLCIEYICSTSVCPTLLRACVSTSAHSCIIRGSRSLGGGWYEGIKVLTACWCCVTRELDNRLGPVV